MTTTVGKTPQKNRSLIYIFLVKFLFFLVLGLFKLSMKFESWIPNGWVIAFENRCEHLLRIQLLAARVTFCG